MRILASLGIILLCALFCTAQNVGIGIVNPLRGKFEVSGVAGSGSTSAIFGTDGYGISLQRNWPTIGFNQYRDNGAGNGKYLSAGYGAIQYFDPGSGAMAIDMFLSGNANGLTNAGTRALSILNNGNIGIRTTGLNDATLWVGKGVGNAFGTAVFSGTNHNSHFSYGANEDTYIRGGKDNSNVIINDISNGDIFIGSGTSWVGINTFSPAVPLDVWQTGELGIRMVNPLHNNHAWTLSSTLYSSETQSTCLMLTYNGRVNEAMGWFRPTDGGYSDNSDLRLKENVRSLEPQLEKLMRLRPTRYQMISDASKDEKLGMIAQEVKQIYPELVDIRYVNINSDETQFIPDQHGLNYNGFAVIAIKAIQEQQQLILAMDKRITLLEEQNRILLQQIKKTP